LDKARYEQIKKMKLFKLGFDRKEQGKIKNFGFSFHDTPQLLDEILTDEPNVDFVQLQINYADWENLGIQSRRCYEVAQKHGIKVVVMEPVKGGTLANLPKAAEDILKNYNANASAASWAVRYAASLDGVFMVLSGMSTIEQMNDNLSYMQDFKPLSQDEQKVINEVVEVLKKDTEIACTACGYCLKGCPKNIAIPNYFALYNGKLRDKAFVHSMYYANLTASYGKASTCIACKQCEKICPQHLKIVDNLKAVAAMFEKK
jgi:predicted aldo/keto reductase-like oxidoreductase